MPVVALVTDLLFATKIRSTAEAVGAEVRLVRSTPDLVAGATGADLVIVDLNCAGLDPVEAIARLRASEHPPRILAYLSHLQYDLADAAREAGADEVMARSRFSSELPAILQPTRPG